MINKKDLKIKKDSFKYIHKITKSMEMISISKYKLLNNKLLNNNNYLYNYLNLLNNLDNNYKNFFLDINKECIDNVFYLVISTDQGLCGNLNTKLFNQLINNIKENIFYKKNIYLFLLGKKSSLLLDIFSKNNINFILFKSYSCINKITNNLGNKVTKDIINFYIKNYNTLIFTVSNIFNYNENNICIEQLLPIKYNCKNKKEKIHYIYEGNKKDIFNTILYEFLNIKILNLIFNNMVSEYSSRIIIMKSASINSEKLFKKVNLIYNKLRQYLVTREIIELISSLYEI